MSPSKNELLRLLALERARNTVLEAAAMTDVLTGLHNRRYAARLLARLTAQDRRKYAVGYSAILLDIDHFKRVNDTYGHPVGDRVLVGVARELRKACRDTDTVVRWGGEEFLVICPAIETLDALVLAHRLRRCVGMAGADLSWDLTASVGVSRLVAASESYERVIGRADTALYRAKNRGRNRVVQLFVDTAA